jgi:hypothetical protein
MQYRHEYGFVDAHTALSIVQQTCIDHDNGRILFLTGHSIDRIFSPSLSLSLLSLSDVPKKEWMNHSETRETEQLSIGYTGD